MDRRVVLKAMLAASASPGTVVESSPPPSLIPEGLSLANVVQYGAKGDGIKDDLAAFRAAHEALGPAGGVLTGPQRTYRLGGTLKISNPVTIDFFNTVVTPYSGHGAILSSKENAPILEYSGTWTRFVGLRNINIVGIADGSARSQDGVVVNNGATAPHLVAGGVRIWNVSIFNAGRYGLNIRNSYASSYYNIYIQGCAHSGVLIDTHCGANLWRSISTVANGSVGFNVSSADGADLVMGLTSEQNQYGIVLDSGVSGWEFIGTHTEWNSKGPLLFKEKSNGNRVDFISRGGGAEPAPQNRGGARNRWVDGSA